jgi:hypothetical protein
MTSDRAQNFGKMQKTNDTSEEKLVVDKQRKA